MLLHDARSRSADDAGPKTTATAIEFRWNLFSITAIFQTSVGARRKPAKPKQAARAVVKTGKKTSHAAPQPCPLLSNSLLAADTDNSQYLLSAEIQQMQEDARKSHHQQREHSADRVSLETLEAAERAKAEKRAKNDHASLAVLEKATSKLGNKTTHCTPPFLPSLWQRPTRDTASQSHDTPSKQVNAQLPSWNTEEPKGSQHTLGSSYAVFSSGPEDAGTPMARRPNTTNNNPQDTRVQTWLEETSSPPQASPLLTATSSNRKVSNWLQNIPSSAPRTLSLSSLNSSDEDAETVSRADSEDDCKQLDLSPRTTEQSGDVPEQQGDLNVFDSLEAEFELVMPKMRADGSVAVGWEEERPEHRGVGQDQAERGKKKQQVDRKPAENKSNGEKHEDGDDWVNKFEDDDWVDITHYLD